MPAPGRSNAVKEATEVILDMAAVIHIIKHQRCLMRHADAIVAIHAESDDGKHIKSGRNLGHIPRGKSQVTNSCQAG